MILSAGAALLPSCLQNDRKSTLSYKNIKVDDDAEKLMADLSESIIPKTNTPGAKDVGAHIFALMMVDDCFPPEDQQQFMKGLKGFQEAVTRKYDQSFSDCSPAERSELLKSLESKEGFDQDVNFFYHTTKRLTIQAFTSSQYYLTKVQVYVLVPGRFYGCVPVKKAS